MGTLHSLIQFNKGHPRHSKFNYHWRSLVCTLVFAAINGCALAIDAKTTSLDIILAFVLALLIFIVVEMGLYWANKDPNAAETRSRGFIWFAMVMGLVLIAWCLYIRLT